MHYQLCHRRNRVRFPLWVVTLLSLIASSTLAETRTVHIDEIAVQTLQADDALYTGGIATCVGFAALSNDGNVGILVHFYYYDDDPSEIRSKAQSSAGHARSRLAELLSQVRAHGYEPADFQGQLVGGGFLPGARRFANFLNASLEAEGFSISATSFGGNQARSMRVTQNGIEAPRPTGGGGMVVQ